MGVWIETALLDQSKEYQEVTPCVGVWIETKKLFSAKVGEIRHTLRGCVD